MDWTELQQEYNETHKPVHLTNTGLKVFNIMEVMPDSEPIVNSYDFANKAYIKSFSKKKGKSEMYRYKHMKIQVKYWEGKEIQDVLAWTKMSEKIWWKLLQLSRKLKRLGYPQGEYVMYWKLSPTLVWLAFVTASRFTQLEPILQKMVTTKRNDDIYIHFKKAIPWFGWKAKERDDVFERFYNPEYSSYHDNPVKREMLYKTIKHNLKYKILEEDERQ